MTAPMATTAAPDPYRAPPPPPRAHGPAAPRPVVLAALGLGAAGAVLVPAGPPGLGLVLLAGLAAVVFARLPAAPRATRWQRVHAVAALLLVAAAAVRDARWLVGLDLLAAAGLGALALVPAGSTAGVLAAAPRLVWSVVPGAQELVRGVRALLAQVRSPGPVVRGLGLAGLLLAVFGPLLTSADARFSALLGSIAAPVALGALPARLLVLGVAAVAAAAALRLRLRPPDDPAVPPPARLLESTSEWLLPLGALDLLLAVFVLVQQPGQGGATYADQVHSGFWQLVAVTVLVLAVVGAAARWVPDRRGVRLALGGLCLLALAVDASALTRLHGYTQAYGLTRLRFGVGVGCLSLAAVLVVVLVAGARSGPRRWLPHAVVLVGATALLATTAADPDAAVARSALSRGDRADTAYLATLSADAVPALLALPQPARDCVLDVLRNRLGDADWRSADLSRARAARLLRAQPSQGCPAR